MSPRLTSSDDGSKLGRKKGLLGCQGPAVEMSGWQSWPCCVLPEVSERVWGKLSCSVGKITLLFLIFVISDSQGMRCRIVAHLFHVPLAGEIFRQEERLPEIQRQDAERRIHTCWRTPTAFLTTGKQIVYICRLTFSLIQTRARAAGLEEELPNFVVDTAPGLFIFIFTELW